VDLADLLDFVDLPPLLVFLACADLAAGLCLTGLRATIISGINNTKKKQLIINLTFIELKIFFASTGELHNHWC